jgi:protein-disulfide isomerase
VSPQITKEYVDSGKVYWIFHNLAFLSQDSLNAAEATYCAQDQNKFWPFHDKLYASQGSESASTFGKDQLKQFAKDLGLDATAFNACLDSGKYAAQVNKDNSYASQQGVSSTPTFFINGKAANLMAADPAKAIQNFRAALDAALAAAK